MDLEGMTERTSIGKSVGWDRPALSRKWHWFAYGEVRSLCGRWMLADTGSRDSANNESPDNCAACKKHLNDGQGR